MLRSNSSLLSISQESTQVLNNLGVAPSSHGIYEEGEVLRRNGDVRYVRTFSDGSSVGPMVGMAVSVECLLFPFLLLVSSRMWFFLSYWQVLEVL